MILTCPSCSASYNVPKDAIGVDGRAVRCKKCKHEWFQEGEKKALEDLINLIQSTDDHIDDLAFDDGKKKPKLPRPKKEKIKVGEALATVTQKLQIKKLKTYLFSGSNRGYLSYFASFMMALAGFMCIFWALVSERWAITHVFPSLTGVYEAGGFPLQNYARINPEEALIIDRVSLETDEGKRNIIGSLINLTSQNIKVPEFKLTYLDDSGKPLQVSTQILPISVIAKEHSYDFNIAVPEEAPKAFGSVHISFTATAKH